MDLDEVVKILNIFMKDLVPPIGFLIVFIVQLKIIRTLRSQMNLVIFYGKQIEELRKIVAGGGAPKRVPEIPPDETGLYEVLKE